MFTGIIEGMGTVTALTTQNGSKNLTVRLDIAGELANGASLAVDGVCLTIVDHTDEYASFDIMPETLSKTTLGQLRPGQNVNYERSLRADSRLDGHFVQGHVDTTTKVASVVINGSDHKIWLQTPSDLASLVVDQGSIAMNGVSLTVAEQSGGQFAVALIPETLQITNLGTLKEGDIVNLEADMIAKHIARHLAAYKSQPAQT